jgi:hypothetical protein
VNRRLALVALTAMTLACSGGDDTPTGPSRVTENFSGSLDDPTRCTCNNGVTNGIGQFTIQVANQGTVEAAATFQPADAALVVRLLDQTFNTVFVVSTRSGNTARFTHEAAPGTYRVQVFLASDGPRQATYSVAVTHS